MNCLKIEVYNKVLKEVSEKYETAEELINSRSDEICSQEKLFAEEVIHFLYFLISFSSKIVSLHKSIRNLRGLA